MNTNSDSSKLKLAMKKFIAADLTPVFWAISKVSGGRILAMALAAGMVLLAGGSWAADQQPASDVQREAGTSLDAFQKIDTRPRKISIQPRSPKNGIKTGLVIAYGHPVQPPYMVEVKGYKIFVNEIQVVPSILDEKEAERTKATASPASTALWNVSNQMQQQAREGASVNEVLEFARNQPSIKSADLYSARSIALTTVDGSKLMIILPNKGATTPTNSQIMKQSKITLRDRSQQINSQLRAGKCVIFVNGGLSEHILSRTFPAAIPQVLDNPNLTDDEKFVQLKKNLGSSVAADMLANYEKKEWDSIRK